jgi:hypothetical protein
LDDGAGRTPAAPGNPKQADADENAQEHQTVSAKVTTMADARPSHLLAVRLDDLLATRRRGNLLRLSTGTRRMGRSPRARRQEQQGQSQ